MRILFPFLFVVVSCFTVSATEVELNSDFQKLDLVHLIDILEDRDHSIEIQDFLNNKYRGEWIKNEKGGANFGITDSDFWIRFSLVNKEATEKSLFFSVDFPLHDYLDLFVVNKDSVIDKWQTGDRRVFKTRPINDENFIFPINCLPNSRTTIYLNVSAFDGLHESMPLMLYEPATFYTENKSQYLKTGLFLGALMLIIVFNFVLIFVFKDKSYLYYVFYVTSFFIWNVLFLGFGFQYFWPESPMFNNWMMLISLIAWVFFMWKFTATFLRFKSFFPVSFKLLNALSILLVLDIILVFFNIYGTTWLILVGLGLPLILGMFFLSIRAALKGYRPAYFVVFAFGIIITGMFAYAFRLLQILPYDLDTESIIRVGAVLEMIILSIGLSDKISTIHNEKAIAEATIVQNTEANAIVLEHNKKLDQLNATKDRFFSIIAHDLKAPFNSIMGFSEILEEQIRAKDYLKIEEYAKIISKSSMKAMDLLKNLLDWSQTQTGTIKFNPETFDLAKQLDAISNLFISIAGQKNVKINTNCLPKAMIFADKNMIDTIMRNLISNAIKFSNLGGNIIISVKEEQEKIVVSIKDNGIGIPKESIGELFQLDKNITTLGTENEKGTGLGLILCNEFIEKHSGEIWVESELGQGSIFYFSIPNQKHG